MKASNTLKTIFKREKTPIGYYCFSCAEKNVDIVNTHFAIPSGPAGQSIARYCKIPNILSIHGGDIFDPSKSLSPHKTPVLSHIVTAMLRRADRVVAQSYRIKIILIEQHWMSRSSDETAWFLLF